MRHRLAKCLAALSLGITANPLLAVEEAEYRAIRTDGAIEIREYAPSVVAEVVVEGEFEEASNRAFRPLFRYIDGDNTMRREIAMTAPVSQQESSRKTSQKIAMTAPVSQERAPDGWTVSFMMPSEYTMETLPRPNDPAITLRQVPSYRAAVIRYSGRWSEARYRDHLEKLRDWLDREGLQTVGDPVWARYNAPFVPWFLRRNEIIIRLR